jgi:hypothetical protein
MNTIQFNKLSELHNGETIFFTKTDFIVSDLVAISKLKTDVILMSGNSDYVIDKVHLRLIPDNLKVWFATNAIVSHPKIVNLPLGIENYKPALRDGHGIGYDRVKIKDDFISNYVDRQPKNLMYANFNVHTNPNHRTQVRNICIQSPHITWEEPTLSVEKFFDRVLDFEAVVCAQGNGPGDNHRIYETLYLNRIPITFNKILYSSLHHNFPVVLLDSPEQLLDYDFMVSEINDKKTKSWDKNMLDLNYWKNLILSYT